VNPGVEPPRQNIETHSLIDLEHYLNSRKLFLYLSASVFVVGGVLVGTREIAPQTSAPDFFSFRSLLRTTHVAVTAPCFVAPLPAIDDAEALAFENASAAASAVDVQNLTPGTARALARFQHAVELKGGAVKITSAYRPAAYQQHLQQVWDKWMHELRDNNEPGCETLKAQVGDEFARHRLLETQRPVPFSDHTRGVGFDAAVTLPTPARARRRSVSLDALARLCSLRRPDVHHDPVHFRFVGLTRRHVG